MRFSVLSHAGLLVEHDGASILFDPWLVGSCYWRSWWNFPPADDELIRARPPGAIYLTHLHWDHFHAISLRRFSRGTRVLVPKAATDRMVRDLVQMGFTDIVEVPHGDHVRVGGLTLHSYQSGEILDSAAVVTDGRTTILNVNDCKIFGRPLRHVLRRHPRIDFVLRSYSSAAPIPYCIVGYENGYADLRRAEDYIEEFTSFCLHVGARWAVPFASNHCFLHRETRQFNDTSVSPEDVRAHYTARARALGRESDCVVMPAGSSWSEASGFTVRPFDYARKDELIEELARRYAPRLEEQYAREDRAVADYKAFVRYFEGFVRAIPRLLARVRPVRVRFDVRDCRGVSHWYVDLARREIGVWDEPQPTDVIVEVHAIVMNDCTRGRMFSTWTPSKRLRIHLADRRHLTDFFVFLMLLDWYELDMLPLRKNLSRRALGVWLRRWRDLIEVAAVAIRAAILRRRPSVADLYPVDAPVRSGRAAGFSFSRLRVR